MNIGNDAFLLSKEKSYLYRFFPKTDLRDNFVWD